MRRWFRSASTSACSSTACRYKSASRSALSRCLLRSGSGSLSGKANELGMAAASGPAVHQIPDFGPDVRLAVAEVSQTANGALRVKLHDKHAALVSIGKHLGMFVDRVQIQERKQISAEPMSAEEWKRQFVREG